MGRRLLEDNGGPGGAATISENAMATKEANGLIQVRIRYSLGERRAECTQWWRPVEGDSQAPKTATQLAAFGVLVAEHFDSVWVNHRPVDSILESALVTKFYALSPPTQGEGILGIPGDPADSGAIAHPPQIAVVMSYRTGLVGRSYRGRNYLPFPAVNIETTDYSGDSMKLQAAVAAELEDMYPVGIPTGGPSSQNHELQVYSPTIPDSNDVTNVVVNTRFDTQRRRAGRT